MPNICYLFYKLEKKMELEYFLYGEGFVESQSDAIIIDPFDELTDEDVYYSFEIYKRNIDLLIKSYGWDDINNVCTEYSRATIKFELPDDKTLLELYKKYKKEYSDNNEDDYYWLHY